MKFGYVTGLLGAATAVHMEKTEVDEALLQESQRMEELCKGFDLTQAYADESSLLQTEGTGSKYHKAVKGTYSAHYGKSKAAIDKENHHILSTQKKCLDFVKKYRGHEKVCHWCRKAKRPSIRWKWVVEEKVWYRWYDGNWHYWGPSKDGFTKKGWTWYKGYWHHGGYVFKYVHHKWYRFQAHKWVYYSGTVPIKPGIPRGPRICRPFMLLKKYGFPTALSAKKVPRCRVGKSIYMWKNQGACRFLGGKEVHV